jgi:hypothetical protein
MLKLMGVHDEAGIATEHLSESMALEFVWDCAVIKGRSNCLTEVVNDHMQTQSSCSEAFGSEYPSFSARTFTTSAYSSHGNNAFHQCDGETSFSLDGDICSPMLRLMVFDVKLPQRMSRERVGRHGRTAGK